MHGDAFVTVTFRWHAKETDTRQLSHFEALEPTLTVHVRRNCVDERWLLSTLFFLTTAVDYRVQGMYPDLGTVLPLWTFRVSLDIKSTERLVALSSCEAEQYAMNTGAAEAMGFEAWPEDNGNHAGRRDRNSLPTRSTASSEATRELLLHNAMRNQEVSVQEVQSENNDAEILTKNVNAKVLNNHMTYTGFIKGIATNAQAGTSE